MASSISSKAAFDRSPELLDPGLITLLLRIVDYVRGARHRANDAYASQVIEENGGRMTDSVERQIAQRLYY